MSAQLIAQLIVALGPVALEVIPRLVNVWRKPELTAAEVQEICAVARKSYEEYIAAAQ